MAEEELSEKELFKLYYQSGATNFDAFKKARLKRPGSSAASSPAPTPTAKKTQPVPVTTPIPSATTPPAAQKVPTAAPIPEPTTTPAEGLVSETRPDRPAPVSASKAKKELKEKVEQSRAAETPKSNLNTVTGGDAASAEYLAFLKQQQELQKCHQKLEDIIAGFERDRRNHQADLGKIRRQANDLMAALEDGTNWNLSSKYNIHALIKDAKLKLFPQELYQPDTKAQYLDIVQQAGNLTKLTSDHGNRETYAGFKSLFDHGNRRLDRIEKEIRNSQLDATEVARLPDALLVQLDHVLGTQTIHEVLQDNEESLEDLLFKLEDTKTKRAEALQDGEMSIAEKHFYDVIQIYERILEIVLEKLSTTEEIRKKEQVFDQVRGQYQQKAGLEGSKLKEEKEKLKQRCEADLKKIFALKEKVDAVEVNTAKKLADQRKQSDTFLANNASNVEAVWSKIEQLEKELENLERERYKEVKKRVHDKDNDEHRAMEYEAFCQVVAKHSELLDLTIRNCDTFIYTTTLLGEFVDTGFKTLKNHLAKQDKDHADLLLETHKQHLEMFRGLYLALGELVHKKEKRIEEIDQMIKASHIQQEIAMETFNPEAKKYSDSKKALLRQRDDIENEVHELKEKAQFALNNFKISEEALHDSGIEFVHPVVEQQEEELEMKAKMVEYKAISVGHVDAIPIKQELEVLKQQMAETKKVVDTVNASAMSSTLPLLRARTPPQHTAQTP